MSEYEECTPVGPWAEDQAPPYMIAAPEIEYDCPPVSEAGSGPEADAARSELYAGQYGGVEICQDPAQLPIVGALGGKHKWIRTPNVEAGQGQDDGWSGLGTEITNHSGRGNNPNASCYPAPEPPPGYLLDQECVEGQLRYGRNTGTWNPVTNNCNDVVDDIIDDCTVVDEESPPPSTGGGGGPGTPDYNNGGGGAGGS